VYAFAFSVLHYYMRFVLFFQLHFMFVVVLCLGRMYFHYRACDDKEGRKIARMYFVALLLGTACWMADMNFCSQIRTLPFNPQGHAWWHIFMGFNSYYGPVFAQFVRARALGWRPTIRYAFGCLAFVHIKPLGEGN